MRESVKAAAEDELGSEVEVRYKIWETFVFPEFNSICLNRWFLPAFATSTPTTSLPLRSTPFKGEKTIFYLRNAGLRTVRVVAVVVVGGKLV